MVSEFPPVNQTHQVAWLADRRTIRVEKPSPQKKRLHLQEGPIDLVIRATGSDDACELAYSNMENTFKGLLAGLVSELPALRTTLSELKSGVELQHRKSPFQGPVANRMYHACQHTLDHVCAEVTPMAAVAGAVADHVLAAAKNIPDLTSLHVNNGGDIAFYLQAGEQFRCGICDYENAIAGNSVHPAGTARSAQIVIHDHDPVRGIASSGRLGRSFSLGIADSVTVLAENAALADVVATLIANQVDLPQHPGVQRMAARELDPDTDLGMQLVVTGLGDLGRREIHNALQRGARYAETLVKSGLIHAAYLSLRGEHSVVNRESLPSLI